MGRGDRREIAMLGDLEVEKALVDAITMNSLDPTSIQEHFQRVPADIAYWNEQLSVATNRYLDAKLERERAHARVFLDEKQKAEAAKTRATEKYLEAVISVNEEYIEAKEAENLWESKKLRYRGIVDALAAKRDMLISLGAHIRLEMLHDPMLRKNLAEMREIGADR